MRLAILAVVGWGCATTPVVTQAQVEKAPPPKPVDACAAVMVAPSLASCAGVSAEHGIDFAHPLEWALIGTFPGLRRELVCPDGTDVVLGDRKGSSVAPQPRSKSQRGGFALRLGESGNDVEFLDSWEVTCGAQTFHLVTNPYRCGDPCPPRGLARVPAPVTAALDRGEKALNEDRVDEARKAFADAAKLAPGLEKVQRAVAFGAARDGAYDDAHVAYAALRKIAPNEPYYELADTAVTARQGDSGPLRAKVDELLARLPSTHELRPQLLCRKAELVFKEDPKKAEEFAKESCAGGFKPCCD
jgi:hypothetical protein